MSQDPAMIKAYQEKKDLYSVIASMSFGFPYEECKEFNADGSKNEDGKERRSEAKKILLGLLYGRGASSIGEQIGKSREEAQVIIDKFFKAFPSVKNWIERVHKHCRDVGQVEDWYGRVRHLPNILLDDYIVEPLNKDNIDGELNPFLECSNRVDVEMQNNIEKYKKILSKTKRYSEVDAIIKEARYKGIYIRSNSNLIAEAERESVNSIIQGGAATLTKLAMINIFNDKELNELGYRLQITIHDEVLGECPEENADKVAKRLAEVMIGSAKPYMNVPMSCDCYNVRNWYDDEYEALVLDEFEKLKKSGVSKEEAVEKVIENHIEMPKEYFYNLFK